MTYPHQELEAASLHFCCPIYTCESLVDSHVGFARTSQECYLSSTPIAMDDSDWHAMMQCHICEDPLVQPMLFPAYELCPSHKKWLPIRFALCQTTARMMHVLLPHSSWTAATSRAAAATRRNLSHQRTQENVLWQRGGRGRLQG
jgi:hypothetical protein